MKKRTGLLGLGLLISAGALTVSCGDETSNGNGANGTGGSTAGTAQAGAALAGNNSGGANTNGGNGTAGSNAGSVNGGSDNAGGSDAAGGDGSMAGSGNANGGDGSMAGAGNPTGGMPGSEGGAPNAGSPSVDGGAGGAGGAGNDCPEAVDEMDCTGHATGFQNSCTNGNDQFCFCRANNHLWNCFGGNSGMGGAGPGNTVDCGQNPVDNADCTGVGQCPGVQGCFCFNDNVNCF